MKLEHCERCGTVYFGRKSMECRVEDCDGHLVPINGFQIGNYQSLQSTEPVETPTPIIEEQQA